MADQPQTLGLIAGQGQVPFMVAAGARAAGLRVVCVGLREQADPELSAHVDRFYWVGLARPGSWIKRLRAEGVTRAIMVGAVSKRQMFTPWRILNYLPDWRAFRIWYSRLRHEDKRNDSLLSALADELASGGVLLEDSVKYCPEHLAAPGLLTDVRPTEKVLQDIEFGWTIAKEMGRLDVGQAIAVKEREVIAVEAIEGTDEMIARAGKLCRAGGWTLIKVAKPNQDMRFDVPTIGPETIENLRKHHAACLVIEAQKTLIVNRTETIKIANKYKIPILAQKP